MRMLHLILPRRIPSLRRLVNTIWNVTRYGLVRRSTVSDRRRDGEIDSADLAHLALEGSAVTFARVRESPAIAAAETVDQSE
jgi:hypothetical protein